MLSGFKSQGSRQLKLRTLSLLVVMTIILLISGCNTLEDGVEKAKAFIPKGYSLVHIQQVSDVSGIVFYTFEEQLSAGIFTKNTLGWDWVGSSVGKLVTYPEGLQWRYADLEDKAQNQISVYYGKVVNKDINRITVTTINGNTFEGSIVETSDLKLWYAFVDEPQVPSVNAVITGYTDEEVVYHFSQPKEN